MMPEHFFMVIRLHQHRIGLLVVTPRKIKMRMEKQPFEDIAPMKNCDFPASHVSFTSCEFQLPITPSLGCEFWGMETSNPCRSYPWFGPLSHISRLSRGKGSGFRRLGFPGFHPQEESTKKSCCVRCVFLCILGKEWSSQPKINPYLLGGFNPSQKY